MDTTVRCEDAKAPQDIHTTSERTSSPHIARMKPMPERNIPCTGSIAPLVGPGEQSKRKWSPNHSDSSTGTLIAHTETIGAVKSGLPGQVSNRDPKRLKSCDSGRQPEIPFGVHRPLPMDSLPLPRRSLPGQMWQNIFTYLPPCSLGRLMCVNSVFRNLLMTDGKIAAPSSGSHGPLISIDKERLWTISRRTFFPRMPRPLHGLSELEMWKLLRGTRCQFCGDRATRNTQDWAATPWTAGPGTGCVRMIWPFAVRSCGNCLRSRLQKETDLLFSSSSALLPALPFAILTASFNYVVSLMLQTESPPPGLQLTKWYFRPQVDRLKATLDEVMGFGVAAAEEWYKGLEADGREKAADMARWEKWELTGGFQAIASSAAPIQHHGNFDLETMRRDSDGHEKQALHGRGFTAANGSSDSGTLDNAVTSSYAKRAPPPSLPLTSVFTIAKPLSSRSGVEPEPCLETAKAQVESDRTVTDVNSKKRERRLQIERRCAALSPPIHPSTLELMDSFFAATQIAMPLTEQAWGMLKPKLLMQREVAEQRQRREHVALNESSDPQIKTRKQQESQSAARKGIADRQWDDTQKSVREQLEGYAECFIRERWHNGSALTKSSCAQFAADVLLHVRHQFYSVLAQEDARMSSIGLAVAADFPRGPNARKLTLENMRWVYDRKVKPLTDHLQKELFLCNACNNHGKYYSLDSVVQHFAAKHTGNFSMGAAVVYWKAEWPETPPFDPNPTAAKAELQMSIPIASAPSPGHSSQVSTMSFADSTISHAKPSDQARKSHLTGHTYTDFAQANGFSAAPSGAPFPEKYVSHRGARAAQWNYGYPVSGNPVDHRAWPREEVYQHTVRPYLPPFPAYPLVQTDHEPRQSSSMPFMSHSTAYQKLHPNWEQPSQPSGLPGLKPIFNGITPSQPRTIYEVHIQDVANIAREIWDGTSEILDLQDSVRTQVIINHVDLRFRDKYTNEPNLALFVDGLNTIPLMSPIRSLSGLVCKACVTGVPVFGGSHQSSALGRRMHTLPALLAHFRSAHVEHAQPKTIPPAGPPIRRLDWKLDMIEMPEPVHVRGLIHASGITQIKLSLIAEALPSYFPLPLPQVPLDRPSSEWSSKLGIESTEPTRSRDHQEKGTYVLPGPLRSTNSRAGSLQHPVTPSREDVEPEGRSQDGKVPEQKNDVQDNEYDPHRPAYISARSHEALSDSHHDSNVRHPQRNEESRPWLSANMPVDRGSVHTMASHRGSASAVEQQYPEAGPQLSSVRRTASFGRDESRPGRGLGRGSIDERDDSVYDSPNAADQFLQNFDLPFDSSRALPSANSAQRSFDNEIHGPHGGRGRDLGHDARDEDWDSGWRVDTSENRRPRANGAYPQTYPSHECEDRVATWPSDQASSPKRYIAMPSSNQDFSRSTVDHLPPRLRPMRNSPSRRPNSRFDRYEAQRQELKRSRTRSPLVTTRPLISDDTYYHDFRIPDRSLLQPPRPAEYETQYTEYEYAGQVTARRTPQNPSRLRYVERPRYIERDRDSRIEYVRLTPRDPHVQEGYYLRHPIANDGLDEHLDYEPSRPHDQVFERNGQLYTRSRPLARGETAAYRQQTPLE